MKILRGLGFFVATVLLYLGVPLLGWGLGDLRGFMASYARLAYAGAVVAFGLAVGWQAIDAPEGIRGRRGQEVKLVARQTVVRFVLIATLYAALFLLPWADRHDIGAFGSSPASSWAGIALVALGFALLFWSGLLLGRQYSAEVTIQEGHKLITRGIYAVIRHPRYLGILLLAVGACLAFRSWLGLILCLPLAGALLFRIRDEERLMQAEFGSEWVAYARRSWRLLPFVF